MPNSDNADARDGNEFDTYDKTEFLNSIMPGFVDQELTVSVKPCCWLRKCVLGCHVKSFVS